MMAVVAALAASQAIGDGGGFANPSSNYPSTLLQDHQELVCEGAVSIYVRWNDEQGRHTLSLKTPDMIKGGGGPIAYGIYPEAQYVAWGDYSEGNTITMVNAACAVYFLSPVSDGVEYRPDRQ